MGAEAAAESAGPPGKLPPYPQAPAAYVAARGRRVLCQRCGHSARGVAPVPPDMRAHGRRLRVSLHPDDPTKLESLSDLE